jgi:hypothetical protein
MTSSEGAPQVDQVEQAAPATGAAPGSGLTEHYPDQYQYVITEAERSAALATIVRACSNGQMTLEEFSRRTDIAVEAVTRADLVAVTGDIDAGPTSARPLKRRWWVLFGHKVRRGRFVLPEKVTAMIFAGEIHLDLRQATMIGPEPTIKLWVLAGNLIVLVPKGIRVEIDQSSLFGGRTLTDEDANASASAPTLQVRMIDVLGSVRVTNDPDDWGRGLIVKASASPEPPGAGAGTAPPVGGSAPGS